MAAMRSLSACAALALGACAPVATIAPSSPAAASLAAAESAFAAQGVTAGVREAFLEYLAGDAVLFRPGPVNGREIFEKNPDPPIVLEWRPAYVEVAASGDFGLSTGPWKVTSKADASKPASYGQFVSIWKREGAGPWRNHVDLGISHPHPELWSAPLQATQLPAGPARGAGEGIAAAEAAFARTAHAAGNRAAYAAHSSDDIRVYREGHSPFMGRDAALASPAAAPAFASWTSDRVEAARSGDLGYAIGRYADAASPGEVRGHFVRVWRREGAAWRLALDVTSPVTPSQ
jgi:ketosteroid isomerase-like protein